jgi:hypothetical protein
VQVAADLLENGHPEDFEDDADGMYDGGGEEIEHINPLDEHIDYFLTHPQFREIRQAIRANPDQVEVYLEQLRENYPELHEAFLSDPTAVEEVVQEVLQGSLNGEALPDDEWVDDDHQADQVINRTPRLLRTGPDHPPTK